MTAKLSSLKMVPVTIHKTDSSLREKSHTLYMKNAVDIRGQVKMAEAHDVVFGLSASSKQLENENCSKIFGLFAF